MRIDCSELNRYAIVYKKDIIKVYGRHNVEMLCVPFSGTLNFLDEELKFFKWNTKHDMYLVKDVGLYKIDMPSNKWNEYVLLGNNTFRKDIVITDSGFKYRSDDYIVNLVKLLDVEPSNKNLSYISNLSIYDIMYCLYIFYSRLKSSNNLHHGLEKAGIPAKEVSSTIQDKVKDTKDKAKLHLVPQQILYDIAEVREYGNKKYPTGGEDNWKLGDKKDYLDAAYRHLSKMVRDGIDSKDEESGIEHYKHLATNIAFICGFMGGEHEDISRAVE